MDTTIAEAEAVIWENLCKASGLRSKKDWDESSAKKAQDYRESLKAWRDLVKEMEKEMEVELEKEREAREAFFEMEI